MFQVGIQSLCILKTFFVRMLLQFLVFLELLCACKPSVSSSRYIK